MAFKFWLKDIKLKFSILSTNHFAILKVLTSTSRPRILKKSSLELFFNVHFGAVDENRGSNRARELRLESFAKDKVLKQNLKLPLNVTEQDTSASVLLRESSKRLSLILFQSSSIEN